jgi:hypothetical protein
VTDLEPGDKVRIDDTALFKKGTESRWSDQVHVVQSASGKTVVLADGTTHKRDKILMVPHNTVITANPEKNVLKVATKKHQDKLYFKREDLNEANVIEGKRNRMTKHRFETKY